MVGGLVRSTARIRSDSRQRVRLPGLIARCAGCGIIEFAIWCKLQRINCQADSPPIRTGCGSIPAPTVGQNVERPIDCM